MAQAMITKKLNETKGTQTGIDESQLFFVDNNKSVKLYYSSVYKERVIGLNLSSSKSFIFTKTSWKKFRKLMPLIETYLDEDL